VSSDAIRAELDIGVISKIHGGRRNADPGTYVAAEEPVEGHRGTQDAAFVLADLQINGRGCDFEDEVFPQCLVDVHAVDRHRGDNLRNSALSGSSLIKASPSIDRSYW
jgi:hypothetical protein